MAKVWANFTKNVKGSAVNFRIVEANDKAAEIVDFLIKYSIPEDPFAIATGLTKDQAGLKEHKQILEQLINGNGQQLDVVVLDNGTIVGASVLNLAKKDEVEDYADMKFGSNSLKRMFEVWSVFNKDYSAHKDNSASSSFDDWGYAVHADYKGIGIEEEIFKARISISKAKNVPLVYSWINRPGLAQALESSGWKIITEINLKKLEKEHGVTFPDANSIGYMVVAKV